MGFEIIDRRGEKKAAEAAQEALKPVPGPTALEQAEGRMNRAVTALANGDMEGVAAVEAECEHPLKTYADVVEFKKTVRGEVQTWKSTGFVVVNLPVGQAAILMVRAVGMRTDEMVFTADYAMPPVWERGETFSEEAMKRLDTFKACSCDERGRCKFHGEALPGPNGPGKWLEADMKRLNKIQGTPLPEYPARSHEQSFPGGTSGKPACPELRGVGTP